MEIRRYKPEDYNDVVTVWRKVLPDSSPHNEPELSLDKKLAENDGLLYVACDDGKIVGTVMGGYDGHREWIYSLAVLPEYRRIGIGKKLVESVANGLKKAGCLKLNLQVRESNTEVIRFYEKCGFIIVPMGGGDFHQYCMHRFNFSLPDECKYSGGGIRDKSYVKNMYYRMRRYCGYRSWTRLCKI